MNALELADVLDDLHEQDKIDGVAHLAMPEAADMLRQQHAKIDKLLAHCDDPECWICGAIICPHECEMHFHHDGCPACAQENE